MTEERKKPEQSYESSSEIGSNGFPKFFFREFAEAVERVEKVFLVGAHLLEWCLIVEGHKRTAIKSARYHLKTTVAIAWLMYVLKNLEKPYTEWLYLGYKENLSGYHLKTAKRYIEAIPGVYKGYRDLTNAESIMNYADPEGRKFICEPEGIVSFKRGRHPDGIIADDILKDPQSKAMDLTQLQKVERAYLEEVESMPKDRIHLFGTAQDDADLFSKVFAMDSYYAKEYPAILNLQSKKVLWRQKYPFDELMRIKGNIGDKAFNKEFMCRPVRSEERYISMEKLDKMICPKLKNFNINRLPRLKDYTYGGFDVGKKTHPSHLSILGVTRKKKLIQVCSKWMDGWDYIDQIEWLKQAIKGFGMSKLVYDNTRAEFDSFEEKGELPGEMEGIPFTAKSKYTMATEMDKEITQDNVLLIDEGRQKRQMLLVDNDLKALETDEGHGDCFFSLMLAIWGYKEGEGLKIWSF